MSFATLFVLIWSWLKTRVLLLKQGVKLPVTNPGRVGVLLGHVGTRLVHISLFSRKIAEIERDALQAAILDQFKTSKGAGGGLGRSPSPPRATSIIPDARPLGTFENQDGRH